MEKTGATIKTVDINQFLFNNNFEISLDDFTIRRTAKGIIISYTTLIDQEIFIHFNKKDMKLTFSRNIYSLVAIFKEKLNADYCKCFLKYGEVYNGMTSWKNIYMLMPGFYLTLNISRFTLSIMIDQTFFFQKNSQRPIEIIKEYIKKNCHTEKIAVEYSGGLDSSAILYAACEAKGHSNIKAITWHHSKVSSKNDITVASKICGILGVEHMKHEIHINDLFSLVQFDDRITAPNLSLSFYTIRKKSHELCNETNYSFLNGHGGDHVFFDPPDHRTLIDAYFDRGLKFTIKKLFEYAAFSGIPLLRVLTKLLFECRHSTQSDLYTPMFSDIARYNDLPAGRRSHFIATIQALFENNVSRPNNVFTPFTSQSMINYCLTKPTYSFFNKTQKRIPFKRDVYLSYGKQPMMRNDKGHITGVYQKYFLENAKIIKNDIKTDKTLHKLGIDTPFYITQANAVNNMGADISMSLIRLMALRAFFKNLELGGINGTDSL